MYTNRGTKLDGILPRDYRISYYD